MIGYTKVWKVNRQLVVADTIEDAIKVYQDYGDDPYTQVDEVSVVECCGSSDALIRKEEEK